MNLRRAINYPYRNIPKIVTIVLILGIALVAFVSMVERGEEMRSSRPYYVSDSGQTLVDSGLAGLFLAFTCFVAWLTGYSLDVIRHAGEGYRSLPAIHFFKNVLRGFTLWLSRFLWVGLVVLVFGLIQRPSPSAAWQLLVWDIALVAVLLILALEFVVAAARCAVKGRLAPAFDLPGNLAMMFENRKLLLALIARLVLLNTAYVVANNMILQGFTWIDRSLKFSNYLIFIAIFCVGAFVFLIQYVSSLHLIGQLANCVVPVEAHHENKANYGDY